MGKGRSREEIRATVASLIEVAEATFTAEGGSPISPETREVLTRSLTRDFSIASDEAMVTEDHIAGIKAQMRLLAGGLIAIVNKEPGNVALSERGRTIETPDTQRINGMQVLSDALDAQRRRTEAAWNAATARMRPEWVAGRDADRRVQAMTYEPERRSH